ncbi:MAG: hypothetical protein OSJ61_25475 [Lachnospiraceae bacterium]|nr:hypothetical protein [Lachnospiraceae bacterium]
MAKIMEIIEKETRGKSYHTYKYSYDSIGLPSIDYDDDPNKVERFWGNWFSEKFHKFKTVGRPTSRDWGTLSF